ncbi:hypothetical protein EVAR_95321_1 [Eumeta japonica]|uniref:Uncharacterized protein n=1 Tax=Eumeta variegata TaxID=151549 RepID=A0A4C1U986_EUMVA|nr:hypothetical protein EVAR_95321_1 [Eumeta japonica]
MHHAEQLHISKCIFKQKRTCESIRLQYPKILMTPDAEAYPFHFISWGMKCWPSTLARFGWELPNRASDAVTTSETDPLSKARHRANGTI